VTGVNPKLIARNVGNIQDRYAFAMVRKADVKKIDLTPRLHQGVLQGKTTGSYQLVATKNSFQCPQRSRCGAKYLMDFVLARNLGNSRDRYAFAMARKADVKKIDLTP